MRATRVADDAAAAAAAIDFACYGRHLNALPLLLMLLYATPFRQYAVAAPF